MSNHIDATKEVEGPDKLSENSPWRSNQHIVEGRSLVLVTNYNRCMIGYTITKISYTTVDLGAEIRHHLPPARGEPLMNIIL
jgi:hypothetical protein